MADDVKEDQISVIKLARRYWPRAARELDKLGYVAAPTGRGAQGRCKILKPLPTQDEARKEALEKIYTESLETRIEGARCELEDLQSELEDWKGGMEGTGLENTEKFSELETAAEAFESVVGDLPEAPDFPDYILKLPVTVGLLGRKPSFSRPVRAAEAAENLQACAEVIEQWLVKNGEGCEAADTIEELGEQLSSASQEVEGIEIPGMY